MPGSFLERYKAKGVRYKVTGKYLLPYALYPTPYTNGLSIAGLGTENHLGPPGVI